MSDLITVPIGYADHRWLASLMAEEVQAWNSELGWDYSPVRSILSSFISQNLLPGYVAQSSSRAVGYGYYLMSQSKGIIGTVFAPKSGQQQEAADEILTHSIRALKDSDGIGRIEAQIMPFQNLSLTGEFTRQGFQCYTRYFLELDLNTYSFHRERGGKDSLIQWDASLLEEAAIVALKSYHGEADALICEDYCTLAGCRSYLRSLVDNPGCGTFLPEASFMTIDAGGNPCGFIISSRIAARGGMIPQIAILPSYQGRGVGSRLMHQALDSFKSLGLHTAGLTVTKKNTRAFDWYRRLGFKIRKEFGAYVWERE